MADPYRYDGLTAGEIAGLLDLPGVQLFETIPSTLDVAHWLGNEGAPAGTLVVAEQQLAGRGRNGAKWHSPAGTGLWLTLLERPADTSGLEVLSLRTGLRLARVLDMFTPEPVRLKWPNDLYVDERKLGGILIEARWREQRLEWVAIGVGINVTVPADMPHAGALDSGTSRIEVISDVVPAMRDAAAATGILRDIELVEWDARDLARGKRCSSPASGIVEGITAAGELRVALADSVARFRSGSLILDQTR